MDHSNKSPSIPLFQRGKSLRFRLRGVYRHSPARAPRPTLGQSAPRLGSGQAPADFVLFVGANSFAGRGIVYRHSRART